MTAKFESQAFKEARYCVRQLMGEEGAGEDVSEVEWNPASGTMASPDGSPLEDPEKVR